MPWRFSEDVEPYADAVLPLLREDPAAHTTALTVVDTLRAGQRFSDEPTRFGWLTDDDGGPARGAISHTPPYDVLLAVVPDAGELVAALRAAWAEVPGVNGDAETVERFVSAWTSGTDLEAKPWLRLRRFALGELVPPGPLPPGAARPASLDDLPLAMTWFTAFSDELDLPDRLRESRVRPMIEDGLLWLWAPDAGEPVALALRTPASEGVARVNCVYTPPEQRGRRYGGAITAAVCEDALARDAERVVLFTDADNPAPNKVYERIGFRPVAEHRVVRFNPPKGV